jgi:dimethylargininase
MNRTAFNRAIVRRPGTNAGDGLTTSHLGRPDIGLMLSQHEAYVRAIEGLGAEVQVLAADDAFPDGCFVEDVAVITPDCAVIARPGAPSRRGEQAALEPMLARYRNIARIEPPGCLDGGDVVLAGDRALIGLSARTNEDGARQLAKILAAAGMQARIVPVPTGLHLKSFVNFLGDDRLLLTSRYAESAELADFAQVIVADGEDYAANCIACGQQLLLPAGFPRTRERLETLGFDVLPLETSEFRKMDGSLSCLSLRFDD